MNGIDEILNLNNIECSCCFENINIELSISCSEAHLFCKQCISYQVGISIGNRQSIKCMSPSVNCNGFFSLYMMEKAIADKKILDCYNKMITRCNIVQAKFENFYECRCGYGMILSKNVIFVKCYNCQFYSCVKCGLYHEKDKCQVLTDRLQSSEMENIIFCLCGERFVKEDDRSCNKMRCPVCQRNYCWICKKKLNQYGTYESYHHFNGTLPDGTKLYGKNCPLYGKALSLKKKKVKPKKPKQDNSKKEKSTEKGFFSRIFFKKSKNLQQHQPQQQQVV